MAKIQHINRTVLRTPFVFGLMVMAPLSLAMAYYGWNNIEEVARIGLVLATVVYIPGVFLMTLLGNVPMKNKLDHQSPEAEEYWTVYGEEWLALTMFARWGVF